MWKIRDQIEMNNSENQAKENAFDQRLKMLYLKFYYLSVYLLFIRLGKV